jgi:6-phosphogluconolactonase
VPVLVVVMGVAGSGKTTVGRRLADALECRFLEGDSLHSKENVERMSRGIPLTDADRAGWLSAIRVQMLDAFDRSQSLIVACSALRQSYRTLLGDGLPVVWVYLKASAELVGERLRHRVEHFMKETMLASQFATLEEPADAIEIDASQSPEAIVEHILADLVVKPDVRVFENLEELSLRAAQAAVSTINDVVRRHGKCSLVLSGGNTPRTLYSLMGFRFRKRIPWADVHVFWGDERYVEPGDPRSNYRMARETLLDYVPCPAANIHPMLTHFSSADVAARDYERTLRRHFFEDWPRFDLVLLGLGDDGHTASLFPGSPALEDRKNWVAAVHAPAEPSLRLTLTLPSFTRAGAVYFFVSGTSKREAFNKVLAGPIDWRSYPAAGVRLDRGIVTWWVDRDAATGTG